MSLLSHVRSALDPVQLARQLKMVCDPWQEDALRSDDDRLALNIHRQGGKSTVASVKALHRALFDPGAVVLIVAPSQRQSSELFLKVLTGYRRLGRPVNADAENRMSLELENGSRVIALPGAEANIRAYSVDLLLIDEAARVDDEVYGAVSPMLAVTRGSAISMSTPFGKRGWWYEAVRSTKWRSFTVPATECPRIPGEWLAEERDRIGDFWFRQEYLCEFLDPSGQVFSTEAIDRIFQFAGYGPFGLLGDVVDATAIEAKPEAPALPPAAVALGRERATRRRMQQVSLEARRKVCRHFWGPPAGDVRVCTKCGASR